MTSPANLDLLGNMPGTEPSPEPQDLLAGAYDTSSEWVRPPAAAPPPPNVTRVVVLPPDPRDQKHLKAYTQNRIRQCFQQLAHNNLDAVQSWLHEVARDSPARAVELFIELARFSLPQLRETSVNVNQTSSGKTYTLDELKQQLEEGS